MPHTESDTRAKLIDPAIHAKGWTEDLVRREETAAAVEIIGGRPRKRNWERVDYVLRIEVNPGTQPVGIALTEAKMGRSPLTIVSAGPSRTRPAGASSCTATLSAGGKGTGPLRASHPGSDASTRRVEQRT